MLAQRLVDERQPPRAFSLILGCPPSGVRFKGERKAELDAFLHDVVLNSFPVLPYGEKEATWHGLERARQERRGRPGPYVDGQIAAIAHVSDLILVTANVKGFARFKDLRVEDWTRSRSAQ